MQGRRESGASRRRPLVAGVLAVLVLGVTLALVSTSSGGTGTSAAKPVIVSGGKGFGEVYAAKASTLKQALFKASLLPANRMSRNIALAGLGRADRKVNYNLALQCWKNNGCSTGTGGKLTVAYIEQFGENVFRQMSKMEFILQALTYPQVGKIIYKSAHSDLNQGIADFKAAIAQKVSYPDFGDAMLPVMKEATKAGIPVASYAWGYVTGPGTNYLTVVGEDTCKLGKAYAQIMNTQVKSGNIAFLGGFPGNPLSLSWQKCEQAALNPNIHVVANEPTNWDPSKVQGVVAGILAGTPRRQRLELRIRARDGTGRLRGVPGRRQAVRRRPDAPDRRRRHGLRVQQAQQPEPEDVVLHLGESADPRRLHGGDDEAQGRQDPAHDRVPDPAAEPAGAQLLRQGLSAGVERDIAHPAEPAQSDVPVGGSEATH